ncbi:hypothetical protein EV384_3899 [Micromonospora kangleipakensis]|uniref:DUF5709 domain-containing protein n=1 Tax=Micromonospora kangleipakensis TaxID=1077942 RepID=A0A4Q8BDG4_9ACTN|nr:DUF5709 domain-containing protein [Micromonospora kangleipakensis]RZU75361.1 hypothetical protein EV384_3899 [Micromonospora kangleipakensis]
MSADAGSDEVQQYDDIEDEGVLDGSDTLEDGVGDPLDVGIVATDRWSGANRFGTTAAEEHAGESLAQRLAEEEPDITSDNDPAPYADEDELTRRGFDRDLRAGRLVDSNDGFGEDVEAGSVAREVGIDGGGASAEEAAVHVIDQPYAESETPLW